MMTYTMMTDVQTCDAELVSRSLTGDRDAFSLIVARYQILICSLAYSRLGHLGQSEDVAQETFITAWKHLRLLREPDKLRAWLCGIVRNRAYKCLARESREPAHQAEPMEALDELQSQAAQPSEQTIGREEEAILWRSLEKIPELYREPLILFYRENESIQNVARQLELSEDAVKQRLSRGRKLLQEEVMAFVESTLRRTAPGEAFSGAVLSALPLTGPAATVGGVAIKSAAAAQSGFWASCLSLMIGMVSGITAHWLIYRSAPTARERQVKKVAFTSLWIFVLGWCVAGQLGMRALAKKLEWSDQPFFAVMAGFWWFYAIVIATYGVVMFRRVMAIRRQAEHGIEIPETAKSPMSPGRRIVVITGVHVACFWWLIDLARQAHDLKFAGIITCAMVALALWNSFQIQGKTGTVAARTVARHLALIWGVILVVLNCRLETWEASLHGIELSEMQRLLPGWAIPLLTLSLLVWVGLLLAVTRPKRGSDTNRA